MSRRHACALALAGLIGLQIPNFVPTSVVSAAEPLIVDGTCTLADAITAANTDAAVGSCAAGSGTDTIELVVDVALTEIDNDRFDGPNGLPRVTSDITIEGNGHVIERAPTAPEFRLFDVEESVFTLDRVTLANGVASGGGGAISAQFARVTINDSIVRDNTAGYGGAITILDAGLVISRSTFRGNHASSDGGAIDIRTTGSGSGGLTLVDSTLSSNSAPTGGAVSAGGRARLAVSNSTISGNGMPDGAAGSRGGGLALYSVRGTITNTTIADNVAEVAAGVWRPEPDTSGDPNIEPPDSVAFAGSVLSNPDGGECSPLSYGIGYSDGYNVMAGTESCLPSDATDIRGADLDLGPLQDNGGPTETHALGPASQALDVIPASQCTLTTDQRGAARPEGAGCDAGAFEAAAGAPTLTCGDVSGTPDELTAAGYNVVLGTDGDDFLPGTPGDDFIIGDDGRDVILAGTGDDVVCAGGGHDVVVGGGGSDSLHGDAGNDRIWGGVGEDLITGGTGADVLAGGDDADDVSGDGADDTIRGGWGDDILRGGPGKDDIRGDAGNDMLFGDGADDVLRGHSGVDVCDGGDHVRGDQAYTCETVINIP